MENKVIFIVRYANKIVLNNIVDIHNINVQKIFYIVLLCKNSLLKIIYDQISSLHAVQR